MSRDGGAQPKYRQIADDLRRRINEGEFQSGRLPTERDLVGHYATISKAQGTIRQALDVLRVEGLIESRVGSGVYVRGWRPIVRNGRKRLSADQWGQGKSIWKVDIQDADPEPDRLEIEQVPAPEEVARAFELSAGELVWTRNRRYLIDGEPVMRSTSYIPDDLARGTRITQTDTGPGGTYARLADAGHAPVRFQEDVHCRMATTAESDDLDLSAVAPVAELVRYAYDEADRVVEINRMILDASRYLLRYDFSA